MHGLRDRGLSALLTAEAVVRDNRLRPDDTRRGCRPLWLTPSEAEALLVLCVASPATAGPGEQDLFAKLGNYFHRNSA